VEFQILDRDVAAINAEDCSCIGCGVDNPAGKAYKVVNRIPVHQIAGINVVGQIETARIKTA
jgi:hypothetical protein